MRGPFALTRDAVRAGRPIALASVIDVEPADPSGVVRLGAALALGPGVDAVGSLGDGNLDRSVGADAFAALDSGRSAVRHYGVHGGPGHEVSVFIEVYQAPRRMLVFGAVDFTAALVRAAVNLGYHVTVCDPRKVFANVLRFPEAHEIVVEWPDRYLASVGADLGPRDAICVLTHDHKFDVPTLVGALTTRVGYIGAMGSRRTHAERVARLREESVTDEELTRIMAPIGIDIGARTPEETAVSILAEIIAHQTGVAVPSLRDGTGPIHPASP